MIDHINENYPRLITNNNFRKYDLKTILEEIIYFLKSGVSYMNYRGE